MSVLGTALRRVSHFLQSDEKGGITVEAVLWLPIYLGFISFITDVSLILHSQSQAMRIVQDGHRGAVIGLYDDMDQAGNKIDTDRVQEAIRANLQRLTYTARATTTERDGILSTVVTMDANDLIAVGLITKLTNIELSFAHYHMVDIT